MMSKRLALFGIDETPSPLADSVFGYSAFGDFLVKFFQFIAVGKKCMLGTAAISKCIA